MSFFIGLDAVFAFLTFSSSEATSFRFLLDGMSAYKARMSVIQVAKYSTSQNV